MNNEHQTPEEQPDIWEQRSYQTGYTNPKKSSRGILAILLVAVIFFCGIATAFSLLNIRLFKDFTKSSSAVSMRFSNTRAAAEPEASTAGTQPQLAFYAEEDLIAGIPVLGATVQPLSSFDQLYYHLPSGLYVTKVHPNTPATEKGLVPGDILISLDDQQIPDIHTLQRLLDDRRPGDTVKIILYRSGKHYEIDLQLRETK